MPKAPGLTKLEQGKILAYSSVSMSIRDIAKAVGRSKSVVHAFLKSPEDYGTKKSPGRPRLLKAHDRTRLRRHAASGEYTASELHQELNIDASVRTVQRELQRCDYLLFEKTNKPPCMTTHVMGRCSQQSPKHGTHACTNEEASPDLKGEKTT